MRVEHAKGQVGLDDDLVFEVSGRRFRIWGAVGLDPVKLTLHYGYDGDMSEEAQLTTGERIELASYMVANWQTVLALARADQHEETRRVEEEGD